MEVRVTDWSSIEYNLKSGTFVEFCENGAWFHFVRAVDPIETWLNPFDMGKPDHRFLLDIGQFNGYWLFNEMRFDPITHVDTGALYGSAMDVNPGLFGAYPFPKHRIYTYSHADNGLKEFGGDN